MIRKDYIVRQFEEFGKMLAVLLTLKKNQNFETFEQELNLLFQKYTNQHFKSIEEMNLLNFENNFVLSTERSFIEKKIIASLLYEKMRYCSEKGENSESENLKKKCIQLLQYLHDNQTENEFDLDIHFKLEQLKS